jgi:hypothetical protein
MELLIANTGRIQWETAQLLDFIDSCNFIFNENNKKCRRAVKRVARFLNAARKLDEISKRISEQMIRKL